MALKIKGSDGRTLARQTAIENVYAPGAALLKQVAEVRDAISKGKSPDIPDPEAGAGEVLCRRCGHKLRSAKSRRRGIGEACARLEERGVPYRVGGDDRCGPQDGQFDLQLPAFPIEDGILVLTKDLFECRSYERRSLQALLGDVRREMGGGGEMPPGIIFEHKDGRWDGIFHAGGVIKTVIPLGVPARGEAAKLMRNFLKRITAGEATWTT